MREPNLSSSEDSDATDRYASLRDYEALEKPCGARFDPLIELIRGVAGVPNATIWIAETERRLFDDETVEALGGPMPSDMLQRELAAAEADGIEICDFAHDPRSAALEQPPDALPLRYYVGVALRSADGRLLGMLSASDTRQRPPLEPERRARLKSIADIIVDAIELRRLRVSGAISKLVGDTMSDALVLVGHNDSILLWNPAAERILGWPAAEAIGKPIEEIFVEAERGRFADIYRRLGVEGSSDRFAEPVELDAQDRDGNIVPVRVALAQWDVAGLNNSSGVAALISDISDRKRLETEYERTSRFLDTVVESLPSMLFVKDAETRRYVRINQCAAEGAGFDQAAMIGHTDAELFGPDKAATLRARDDEVLDSGEVRIFEGDMIGQEGRRLVRTKRVAFADPRGKKYLLGITDDITDHVRANQRASFLADHDALTGLRNRRAFMTAMLDMERAGTVFDVILCNISRFRQINDVHGRAAADALLVQISYRLRQLLGPEDRIGRVGGSEFAILRAGDDANAQRLQFAQRVLVTATTGLSIGGTDIALAANIGAARFPSDGDAPLVLMNAAELALERAKRDRQEPIRFFEAGMDTTARHQNQLVTGLPGAFDRGEMTLAFQPIAGIESGRVEGFESLMRWHHPGQGQVSPEKFIALAEQFDLIGALGDQALTRVTHEAATWQPSLSIAVNVSPGQIHGQNFPALVERCLAESELEPRRLELEITEGMLLDKREDVIAALHALRDMGVRITIDDFGTGYSSMAYLDMFPFDKIKIDRSFVRKMHDSQHAFAVVRAVIGLGRDLDILVVAEGVEREEDMTLLRELGCDQVQGYLIARPDRIEAFENVVIDRRTAARSIRTSRNDAA